jgi:hypothetical protein
VALAEEGRTFRSGLPRPLDLALFMREFEQEVQAPFAARLVRAANAPLAWLADRRGLARYQAPAFRDQVRARRAALTRPVMAGPRRPAPRPPARSRLGSADGRGLSGPPPVHKTPDQPHQEQP